MGSVRSGVPTLLAERLRSALSLVGAVETGTYLGKSAEALAEVFPRVTTIEWAEHLWKAAQEQYADREAITFLLGPSPSVLREVVASIDGPTLFWLDGHWSGGDTAGQGAECPVLEEIAAIDLSPFASQSAILIDDARMFLTPPPPPHDRSQWPGLMDLADALRENCDRYVTILEDVIVAVPRTARTTVDDYGALVTQNDGSRPRLGLLRRRTRA